MTSEMNLIWLKIHVTFYNKLIDTIFVKLEYVFHVFRHLKLWFGDFDDF